MKNPAKFKTLWSFRHPKICSASRLPLLNLVRYHYYVKTIALRFNTNCAQVLQFFPNAFSSKWVLCSVKYGGTFQTNAPLSKRPLALPSPTEAAKIFWYFLLFRSFSDCAENSPFWNFFGPLPVALSKFACGTLGLPPVTNFRASDHGYSYYNSPRILQGILQEYHLWRDRPWRSNLTRDLLDKISFLLFYRDQKSAVK